jgi:anti-sigma factor RsiW
MNRVDDVMLMAYVDGEVDAVTAREIEASIAADASVAARVQHLRASAVLAKSAFTDVLHEPVPDRLVAALGGPVMGMTAALRGGDAAAAAASAKVVPFAKARTASAGPRRAVIGWAMAASLAALVVGYGAGTIYHQMPEPGGLQNASSDRWLDNIAGYYNIYTSSLSNKDKLLVDFSAEDVPELEKWFGNKLNRKLGVPDLTSKGFTAQGGRLVMINSKPAAQFLYLSDKGELVELVIAFTDAPYMPAQLSRKGDVNIVHWRDKGYAYAFAGTMEPARLQEIADGVWKDLERAS